MLPILQKKLNKVTTLDIRKFLNTLLESGRVLRKESHNKPKGLSPKTVANIRTMLYSAFDKAVAEHLILTNPCVGCKLPKQEHSEMKTPPAEQLSVFLREARESGKYEFNYTELAAGLRRGELLGLKWEDIDFGNKVITVRRRIVCCRRRTLSEKVGVM